MTVSHADVSQPVRSDRLLSHHTATTSNTTTHFCHCTTLNCHPSPVMFDARLPICYYRGPCGAVLDYSTIELLPSVLTWPRKRRTTNRPRRAAVTYIQTLDSGAVSGLTCPVIGRYLCLTESTGREASDEWCVPRGVSSLWSHATEPRRA